MCGVAKMNLSKFSEMFDKKKKRSSSLVRDEIRDRGDYFSIDSKEKYALRAAHF